MEKTNDVDFDPAGNVYVVGAQSHNAFRISPTGEITEIIDANGEPGVFAHRGAREHSAETLLQSLDSASTAFRDFLGHQLLIRFTVGLRY